MSLSVSEILGGTTKNDLHQVVFCGATENLACIILISVLKQRFNRNYSDELRSPQKSADVRGPQE